jgi:PAS domain S-box-containing protein
VQRESQPPAREPDRIRVLHVDDHAEFAAAAADLLEHENDRLAVTTAADAEEALERLAADRFDCVVSDYEMPGCDGIELLDAVREREPELPFILFTGRGSEEIASEAVSAGVTDYLQKEGGTDHYAILANRIVNVVEGYRSREALAERKRRLETLIDNLPGMVYRCRNEPGWPMEFVEGECERLTGYPAAALERGEVLWGEELVHPEDREGTWTAVQDALEAGDSFEVTYRIRTRDGDVRWVWERGREVSSPAGTALEGFITDITARKRRQAELERYEGIIEASGDPVYTLDEEGRLTFANEAFEEMTGYDAGELLGEHASVLMPEEDIEEAEALIRSLLDSDRERGTVPSAVHTADGTEIPCEVHVSLLPPDGDGGFRGTVGVLRDVSDRVERERRLDRLRNRAQALMYTETVTETAEVATEAADEVIGAPLSGVHLVNEAGDAILPAAVTETVERTFEELPRYPRGADPGTRAAMVWEAFEADEVLRMRDTADEDRLAEHTRAGSVIVHPVGEHGVFIVSSLTSGAFDETDEALVELLATSLRTALDRVEREAELRRQRDRLRQRNERLDQFTGVVSHDLRNPLNVANARLALAREECDSDYLDGIEEAHSRMEGLIEDLLTLAREGETVTDPEPVALAELVESCWRNVATGGMELTVETDRTVRADRSRLKQLLENLLGNAAEHGGGLVRVGDTADRAGFYVADDGPGVEPDEREDVFDAGYSTGGTGTGMGLAIVERVADAHGWSVAVAESTEGGARFEVTGLDG